MVNSGVSGQTTDQMLERFEGSVLYYKPQVVVLEGGTNDLTRVETWKSSESTIANMAEMARRAAAFGAKVFISSILPCNASQTGDVSPQELIVATNKAYQELAASKGYGYIDFYTPLSDSDGRFKDGYHSDGVHPDSNGYDVMEQILLAALK